MPFEVQRQGHAGQEEVDLHPQSTASHEAGLHYQCANRGQRTNGFSLYRCVRLFAWMIFFAAPIGAQIMFESNQVRLPETARWSPLRLCIVLTMLLMSIVPVGGLFLLFTPPEPESEEIVSLPAVIGVSVVVLYSGWLLLQTWLFLLMDVWTF